LEVFVWELFLWRKFGLFVIRKGVEGFWGGLWGRFWEFFGKDCKTGFLCGVFVESLKN
jgi:hypothetical protein